MRLIDHEQGWEGLIDFLRARLAGDIPVCFPVWRKERLRRLLEILRKDTKAKNGDESEQAFNYSHGM